MNDDDVAHLKELITAIIDERDKKYTEHFIMSEKAVSTALETQEKAKDAALLAAKEAVGKSEEAANKRFDAMDEKIEVLRTEIRGLGTSRDQQTGHSLGARELGAYILAGLSLALSVVLHYLGK